VSSEEAFIRLNGPSGPFILEVNTMGPRTTPFREESKRKPAAADAGAGHSRAAAPRKSPGARKAPTVSSLQDSERWSYVAEAAYYLAERRGFVGGSPEGDWAAAEAEIDRMFAARRH